MLYLGMDKIEDTNCYSYKVEMIVQVFAADEESARLQLDDKGGYVTTRKVRLMDSVPVYNGVKK
jgi:chorismate-pyruvate lyase